MALKKILHFELTKVFQPLTILTAILTSCFLFIKELTQKKDGVDKKTG